MTTAARGESAYLAVLRQARAGALTAGRAELDRIAASILLATQQLDAIASRADLSPLTTDRADGLRRELDRVLQALETRLATTGDQTIRDTVKGILQRYQSTALDLRQQQSSVSLSARFDKANIGVISVLASRRGGVAATYQTLIKRNMADAAPVLDRLLEAGIARGQAIPSLARAVADLLEERLPDPSLRVIRMGGLSSIASDARRIARTETMNALRESNRAGAEASGMIAAHKWQVNSAHPAEDECDDLADEDTGFGPGYYAPEDWPEAPHPNCGCYQGDVILLPVSEWT